MAWDIGSVLATQLLVTACGVVTGVLTARLLGPGGKGIVVFGNLMAGITAAVAHLGLPYSVTYRVSRIRDEPTALGEALLVAARVLPINLLIILGVYVATFVLGRATIWKGMTPSIAVTSAVLCIITLVQALIVSIFGGLQHFRARNASFLLGPLLSAIALLVIWLAKIVVSPLLILDLTAGSMAVGVIASAVYFIVRYRGSLRLPVTRRRTSQYLGYGLKFQLALVAQGLNYRLDSLLINAFAGNAVLGLYSVAVSMAESVLLVPTAVNNVLYPRVSASTGENRDNTVALTLGTSLYAVGAGCLVLAGTMRWLIPLVFGPPFAGAVTAAYLLLPGMISLTIVKIVCHVAAGFGRPQYATYITAVGLCVTVPLNVVLIPRYGLIGGAFASTAAYTASAVVAIWLYGRLGVEGNVLVRGLRSPLKWIRQGRSSSGGTD